MEWRKVDVQVECHPFGTASPVTLKYALSAMQHPKGCLFMCENVFHTRNAIVVRHSEEHGVSDLLGFTTIFLEDFQRRNQDKSPYTRTKNFERTTLAKMVRGGSLGVWFISSNEKGRQPWLTPLSTFYDGLCNAVPGLISSRTF